MTPDLARTILHRFIVEHEQRQRYAKADRDRMHAMLERGENPTGHRAEWVRQSSTAVVEALLRVSQEYNLIYPYDIVLVGDLLDVLVTTRRRFTDAVGGLEDEGA
jgi:hypothetical protein